MKRVIQFRICPHNPIRGKRDCYVKTLQEIDLNSMFCSFDIDEFTGLTDKNGKEIYENDIVEYRIVDDYNHTLCTPIYATRWGQIEYVKGEWLYCRDYLRLSGSNHKLRIVGNIHKNPELLSKNDASQGVSK